MPGLLLLGRHGGRRGGVAAWAFVALVTFVFFLAGTQGSELNDSSHLTRALRAFGIYERMAICPWDAVNFISLSPSHLHASHTRTLAREHVRGYGVPPSNFSGTLKRR